MRNRFAAAAVLTMAALPAWAQSPADVSGTRTLSSRLLACTDVLVPARPQPKVHIKASYEADGRIIAGPGHVVVLTRSTDDGLAPGQRYAVRRLSEMSASFSLTDREGFRGVRTAGFVTVTAVDEQNALATIDFACDAVYPGDFLEPYDEPAVPSTADAMGEPDFSERITVLAGLDARSAFGDGDVFSIQRGAAHGVTVGARYAIYRDRRDGTAPLIYVGDVVVMETFELTSKVAVVKAVDVMTTDDVAVPRRKP